MVLVYTLYNYTLMTVEKIIAIFWDSLESGEFFVLFFINQLFCDKKFNVVLRLRRAKNHNVGTIINLNIFKYM